MNKPSKMLILRIKGMDCAEEVAALKAELLPLPGVQDLAFDVLNAKMTVTYAEDTVTPAALEAAVARTGMTAEPWRDLKQDMAPVDVWTRWGRLILMSVSGVLIVLGFLIHGLSSGWGATFGLDGERATPWLSQVLYTCAAISGGWYVVPKAWRALLRLRPDMNLLMTVAVVGAVLVQEYFEAAAVSFLFALSLVLESWSVGRARRAIAALMALTPETARVLGHGGREEVVEAADVPVGTTVVVRPGEKFPLDGRITTGETTVNQAPITGESMPVTKTAGDEVFAGTINEDGAVEFATTKPAQDTTLAHIIKMVGDAQSRRSPSEQWVETFARYYTPAVMILAVLVMAVPPLLLDGAWSKWFYEGLVLLVIACPCALVISTPVSIVAALASAARHGVLIKGGPYVEMPARLKAIALDKTGTLTEGHPQVRQVVPLSGHDEKELLEIASAVEMRSEHPLARAVVRYADGQDIRPAAARDFQAIKGKGATAMLGDKPIWIGSHRYLEERGQETPEIHDLLETIAADGSSAVVVGENHHVCGLIAVADKVRANARDSVAGMKAAGIRHVIMLTGDNRATADEVGRETGVDEVRAELLPADKVAAVEELVTRYGQVAMVGDGVNDAPAMARATLGIAMGAAGTDAALETADIALMSDDLSRLAWLVHHSRRTVAIIRQNIVAALVVKACFVLLTLAGQASLWTAIAADMGVSLLVVFNALRLLGDTNLPDSGSASQPGGGQNHACACHHCDHQ